MSDVRYRDTNGLNSIATASLNVSKVLLDTEFAIFMFVEIPENPRELSLIDKTSVIAGPLVYDDQEAAVFVIILMMF